jgi:hypothetical protein
LFSVQAKAKVRRQPRLAMQRDCIMYRSRSLQCFASHRIWKCMYTAVSIELFLFFFFFFFFVVVAHAIMQPKPSPRFRALTLSTRVDRAIIQTTSMQVSTTH